MSWNKRHCKLGIYPWRLHDQIQRARLGVKILLLGLSKIITRTHPSNGHINMMSGQSLCNIAVDYSGMGLTPEPSFNDKLATTELAPPTASA